MSNNFHSDSLEDFFRKELNDGHSGIESDGWDIPSDAVWDNIETGITIRQIRGRKWGDNKPWLSVAAAILFITIFYQTFSLQQNNSVVSPASAAQAIQTEPFNSDPKINSTNSQNSFAKIPASEMVENKKVVAQINTATKNIKNQKNLNTEKTNESLQTTPDLSSNLNNNTAIPTGSIASNNAGGSAIDQSNHTNYLNTGLSKQNQPSLNLNSKRFAGLEKTPTTTYNSKMIQPALLKQHKTYVSAYLGAGQVTSKMKGAGAGDLNSLMDQQTLSSQTYQAGIKIGYQLSDKWSVETGLAYNKIQQKSVHNLDFAFDSDKVNLNTQGEYEGIYAGNLKTSLGEMPVDVLLSYGNTSPSLTEGQSLPVELQSTQTLEMLQLPVAVRYTVGNGRLKLHLSAGATAHFLANKEMKLTSPSKGLALPGLANVNYQNSDLTNDLDLNSLTLSLTGGAELDYALTDQLHLSVAPNYSKGVTPIYENDDVDTELSQATVLLSLNYYF